MNQPSTRRAAAVLADHGHLYLTGYRGSGKSSVGRELARRLNRPAIDLDDEIERAAGCTIREIFATAGETGFRDWETRTLQQVVGRPPAVIALGGGAVLKAENREQIARSGLTVWLQIDAQTVCQRLQDDASTTDRRPALTRLPQQQEVAQLLEQRQPLYHQIASIHVTTVGRSIAAIVTDILERVAGTGSQQPQQGV